MIPYVILTPKWLIPDPLYKTRSAGVRALDRLKDELEKRGIEAHLTDGRLTPEGTGTVQKTVELIERGAITIYHENVYQNVLRSRRPVAYILGEWGVPSLNQFCKTKFYYTRSMCDRM